MSFDERMAQLRVRFLTRAAAERLQLADAAERLDREELRRLAHGIAGSAGVFGFPDIGERARALEEAVDAGCGEAELSSLTVALTDLMEAADLPS